MKRTMNNPSLLNLPYNELFNVVINQAKQISQEVQCAANDGKAKVGIPAGEKQTADNIRLATENAEAVKQQEISAEVVDDLTMTAAHGVANMITEVATKAATKAVASVIAELSLFGEQLEQQMTQKQLDNSYSPLFFIAKQHHQVIKRLNTESDQEHLSTFKNK